MEDLIKMEYSIRKATEADIPAILSLYKEQFREMAKHAPDFIKEGNQQAEFIERIIADEKSDILVSEENEIAVGFVLLQIQKRADFDFFVNANAESCYIMDIIVTERSRNKGLGTALLNSAKEWAKEHGCVFINLDVLSGNDRAAALYEKLGFKPKAVEMYTML